MRWDLLEKAAQYAAKHPEHFDMGVFRSNDQDSDYLNEDNTPACGTVACLAGTIVWQNDPKRFSSDFSSCFDIAASEILEAHTDEDLELLRDLFFELDWIDHTNVVEVVGICKAQGIEGFHAWIKNQSTSSDEYLLH